MRRMAALGRPLARPARSSRGRRALVATAVAGLLAVTTACSGDDAADPEVPDDTSETTGGASPDPTASASEPPATVSPSETPRPPDEVPDSEVTGVPFPLLEGEECDAEVTLSGVREAEWSSAGTVAPSTGDTQPTTYQSADGASVVTVYAADAGFDAAVVVQLEGAAFSSSPGDPGLDVAADGSGAVVDVEALAAEDPGTTLRIQATFTC